MKRKGILLIILFINFNIDSFSQNTFVASTDTTGKDSIVKMYFNRANQKEQVTNYKSAIKDYNTVLSMCPNYGAAYLGRSNCYLKTKEYSLGISDATTAMLYYKNDNGSLATLYVNRAYCYQHLNNVGKALSDYNYAVSLDPKYKKIYFYRCRAYMDTCEYELALKDCNIALSSYHDDTCNLKIIYYEKGFVEMHLGQYQNAVNDQSSAIAINPQYAIAHLERGRVYLLLKDTPAAAEDYKIARIKLDSTGRDYIYSLFFTGDSVKAIKFLHKRITDAGAPDVDLADDYYDLACFQSLLNKPTDAISDLKKAFDYGEFTKYILTDPDFDTIRNNPQFISFIKELNL